MRNHKLMKTVAVCAAALMLIGSLSACGGSDSAGSEEAADDAAAAVSEDAEAAADDAGAALSGSIALAGSTSMEELCEAMCESFMMAYPDVTVTAEYTGSSAGIESLVQGSVDIGNASRALKDGELENGAVQNVVAIDGIAVITDKENTVTDLTAEQLAAIYTGEITNWSELGGSDEAIVVIGREAGSGTRSAFEELLEVEDVCNYAQELDSTGAVLAKVAVTPGAIGYISLNAVDDTILPMSLNGVAATEENIAAGDYLLSRPFVMATIGEIAEQSELVQTWFEYLGSEEGQSVITALGLVLPQ